MLLPQGPPHFSIHTLLSKDCTCSIIILDLHCMYCIFFQKTGFEFPALMENLYLRIVNFAPSLQKQVNQHYRYLRCLAAPIYMDISTWPSRRKCWLRLLRTSLVTSPGALVKFSLPSRTLRLSLLVMNILLCFPVRVRVLRSTVNASWIPWCSHRIMVRFIDLIWLLMMGLIWIFSSIKVRRWRTCSSMIILFLTLYPHTILGSRFSKP